jgi:hypothetical protein
VRTEELVASAITSVKNRQALPTDHPSFLSARAAAVELAELFAWASEPIIAEMLNSRGQPASATDSLFPTSAP